MGTAAQAALQALMSQLGAGNGADTADSGDGTSDNTMAALLASLNASSGSSLAMLLSSTQDPLLSFGQDSGTGSIFNSSGSTAQDALLALLQAIPSGGSSTGTAGSPSTATASGTDFASAIALYQSQINQQMLSTMFGTGTAGI